MQDKWIQFRNAICEGEPFVSISIIETKGSAPRKEGARLIVKKDNSIMGTIGGGKLEAEALAEALNCFIEKKSKVTSFHLTGQDASEMEMICGGSGQMLLVYVDPTLQMYHSISERLMDCENQKMSGKLLTSITEKGIAKQVIVLENNGISNENNELQILNEESLYIELIEDKCDLYLFGAGHVAQKLAPIAESVGFNTIVIDDRSEYGNSQRFPHSKIILLPSLENELPDLSLDQNSYIAIMTRGHLQDKHILNQLMSSSASYIGMIGSVRKRDLIYKNLVEEGNYQLTDFNRVHCPIGVDIMAESPEEIAISIVAELIKVRAISKQAVKVL